MLTAMFPIMLVIYVVVGVLYIYLSSKNIMLQTLFKGRALQYRFLFLMLL